HIGRIPGLGSNPVAVTPGVPKTGCVGGRVELVVGGQARMREVLKIVQGPFEQARDIAQRQLGAADIDVHLVDAPDECIPEWGLGGYAYGPHSIVLAVGRDQDILAAMCSRPWC